MNLNTADMLRGATASLAAGKEVTSDSVSNLAESPASSATADDFITASESTQEDLLPGEDAPSDSPATGKAKPDSKQETSAKEVITVTDETGRRRKVEIDYTDRKAIRKAHELSNGARKWQSERDQARTELAKEQQAKSELQSNWNVLEKAFQEKGEEGVLDLLAGRPGAFKQFIQKHVDRAKFLENASPKELEALQAREQADQSAKELSRIRKENEEFRKQMSQKEEAAELHSLKGDVNPVFDKYRFADKLGDANDEHMFDEMLWNSALKRLEPYEEKGVPLTPELIDREFRNVAMAIRKRINLQAEKKATKVVAQKKQEATEHVQTAVKSGYKAGTASAAQEARDLINTNNLTGLLKGWSKYGGLFNK